MACRDFEQLVALFVEDDLPPTERRHTEAHLRVCAPCTRLAEELKESQGVFKSIRQQVPTQTMLTAVRTRVLERAHTRVSWFERIFLSAFGQRATLAGIALLIVGGSALWILKQPADVSIPSPPRMTPVLPAPAPMPAVASHVVEVTPVRRRPAPVVNRKSDAPKETTIKWLTDDPNVIIYWVVEEKGD
jgi:hypothetical protein